MRPTRSRSICRRAPERLTGTSQAAAQQGATLSLVDGELVAYENATLTGGNAYSLTGLARGLSGSAPAYHSTGAPFARLDGAIVKYDLPANLVGQTHLFQIPVVQRLRRRRRGPVDVRGLFLHPAGGRRASDRRAARLGLRARSRPGHGRAVARRRLRPGRRRRGRRRRSTSGPSRPSRIRSWRRSRPGPIRISAGSPRPSPYPTTSARRRRRGRLLQPGDVP